MLDRMINGLLEEGGSGGRTSVLPGGIALLPFVSISDRATIGYEVVARPPLGLDPMALVHHGLHSRQQVSPAVLFVPLPPHLSGSATFPPAELTGGRGHKPSEVAWVLPRSTSTDEADALDDRVAELRAAGFLTVLDADGWPRIGHDRILAVRPDYLLLGADLVAGLRDSLTARAELAGLISFAARLDIRLMARGVDDEACATALIALGVQFGSGTHLSPPLVLDAALAIPGDRVVGPSWFRQHPPRKLEAPGSTEFTPAPVADLPVRALQALDGGTFAQALAEVARRLQAEHDPTRILEVVTDLLPRILPMSALAIFEAEWDTDMLIPRVIAGLNIEGLRDQAIPMSRGITGWAFTRGLPYNCDNTVSHPAAGTVPGTERDDAAESLLVIPLVAGDQRIGVLDVWRVGVGQFTTRDLERCGLVAHLTAAAWHNAKLYRELEDRARTDSLTGLHNMRWWDEVAPQHAARSLRHGTEIGVLLVDLDHFKLVNDTGGHAAGDRVLRDVARALISAVRIGDDVVRFGGEEFLILLPESGLVGALRVAESIRLAVAGMTPGETGGCITASIGVAVFPLNGPSLDDVVRAADLAMYRAKEEGRNRVVAASS
jgi:diguanylate cyclase (GGDEF)-like protein